MIGKVLSQMVLMLQYSNRHLTTVVEVLTKMVRGYRSPVLLTTASTVTCSRYDIHRMLVVLYMISGSIVLCVYLQR